MDASCFENSTWGPASDNLPSETKFVYMHASNINVFWLEISLEEHSSCFGLVKDVQIADSSKEAFQKLGYFLMQILKWWKGEDA